MMLLPPTSSIRVDESPTDGSQQELRVSPQAVPEVFLLREQSTDANITHL